MSSHPEAKAPQAAAKMTAMQRATEFCAGAFGPFGVDVEPYAEIVAELIEGAEQDARLQLLAPCRALAFAKLHSNFSDSVIGGEADDDLPITIVVTLGDIRRARAAIAKATGGAS